VDSETGDHFLILENGRITDVEPGKLDIRVLNFARNDLRLPQPEVRQKRDEPKIDLVPSRELLAENDPAYSAEFQWRLAPALTVIVLGFLALPLSHSQPREGRGVRVMLGILVYLVYGNMLYLCKSWIASGVLPASIGMWWVHLVFLAVGFLWIRQQGRLPVRNGGSAS